MKNTIYNDIKNEKLRFGFNKIYVRYIYIYISYGGM